MNQMPINGATRKLKRPPRLPQGDGPAQTGGGLARSATSRHFAALPAVRLKE